MLLRRGLRSDAVGTVSGGVGEAGGICDQLRGNNEIAAFDTQAAFDRVHERIDSVDTRLDDYEVECADRSARVDVKLKFIL